MEYLDMVNQIVAAEHNARALAAEGKQQQERVQANLNQEIAGLRERYMEEARRRVQLVRETEQAAAEEEIARLDQRQRQAMSRVEAVYEKNRDQWVDTLFSLIAGVAP